MHSVLTHFFQLGQYLVSPMVLALVVTAGYSFDRRNRYAKLLLLLLFSLVLNPYLKSIWKVPLPASAGVEGWAFPSGHMQSACVFWGYLAYELRNRWFSALVVVFLLNVGFGLVYLGYHHPADVLAAMITALVLCSFYRYFLHSRNVLTVALILCAITLFLIPQMPSRHGVWIGIGGIVGCALGTLLASWRGRSVSVAQWQSFLCSLIGQLALFTCIHYTIAPMLPFHWATMLTYGMVVFWLFFNPWQPRSS